MSHRAVLGGADGARLDWACHAMKRARVFYAMKLEAEAQIPDWLDRAEYPFASHVVALNPGRMHYVDEGHWPTILLVHGTPTWSFEYRHLIRALAGRARVIAPDHFGFGLSDRPADFAYTPEAHAAALREFVERLDLRDITLVVHDYGGPIGLPLALDADSRVSRVVLLNTWMWPFDDDPDMQKKGRFAAGGLGRDAVHQLRCAC